MVTTEQEKALGDAYEVAQRLEAWVTEGKPRATHLPPGEVAATVLVYLGHFTPEVWAELRRLTEHTRGRLDIAQAKEGASV